MPALLPTVLDIDKPAELQWLGDAGQLDQKHPDGSVELSGGASLPGLASSSPPSLPRQQGVCEAIVQLEGVKPGTGVFLGDEQGQIGYRVSFLRDEATGRTVVLETGATDTAVHGARALRGRTGRRPSWGPTRCGRGCCWPAASLKCWVSSDGVHWARALRVAGSRAAWGDLDERGPVRVWPGASRATRSGRVRRVMLARRLKHAFLNATLAPADLVHRAPRGAARGKHLRSSDWLVAAHASRPAAVDPAGLVARLRTSAPWPAGCRRLLGLGQCWKPCSTTA